MNDKINDDWLMSKKSELMQEDMSNTDIKKKDIQTRSINDVGKHCMLQGSGCYWLLVGSFTSFAEDSYRASQKKVPF